VPTAFYPVFPASFWNVESVMSTSCTAGSSTTRPKKFKSRIFHITRHFPFSIFHLHACGFAGRSIARIMACVNSAVVALPPTSGVSVRPSRYTLASAASARFAASSSSM